MRKKRNLWNEFERFHDNNRYFIPLLFIATVLMTFGINYLGPVTIINKFNLTGPLTIKSEQNVLALTLLPGWVFRADVVTTKPATIELVDLSGNVINSTTGSVLFAKINYLEYYILRLKGNNYALIDLTYYVHGLAPYALEYSFFGTGLLLFLLTLAYYFLKPIKFKLKRKINSKVDAFFYPTIIFLSIIVFWVFRNALMWVMPKSYFSIIVHAALVATVILLLAVLSIRFKESKIKSLIVNYALVYFLLYIISLLTYGGLIMGYSIFFLNFCILGFLIIVYSKSKSRIALTYFTLAWTISVVLSIAAYVIGVPVDFDNVLAMPNTNGTLVLLAILELFMLSSTYFMLRGYYSKSILDSLEYGLYAGVMFQGILQTMVMTNVML